jgi:hypothetical protein
VHSDTTGAKKQGRCQRRLLRKKGSAARSGAVANDAERLDFRVGIKPVGVTRQLPIAIRLEATSAAKPLA